MASSEKFSISSVNLTLIVGILVFTQKIINVLKTVSSRVLLV